MIDFVATFIVFFAVIDPIGTIPVFIAVTSRFDKSSKNKIALISTLVAAAILVFFVIAGEIILIAMSIPLAALNTFNLCISVVSFRFDDDLRREQT